MVSEIAELQKKLKLAQNAQTNIEIYFNEREELEYKIQSIKEDKHHYLIEIHKKSSKELPDLIATYDNKLNDLKSQKSKIDSFLDEIESFSHSNIDKIKQKLSQHILKKFPAEATTYNKFKKKLDQNNKLIHAIKISIKDCQPLKELLESALKKSTNKKISLLNTLLGRSPYYELSRYLQTGEMLSQKLYIKFVSKSTNSSERLKKIYNRLTLILIEFSEICSKRWGFHKRELIFEKSLRLITETINELQKIINELKNENMIINKEFEKWLLIKR